MITDDLLRLPHIWDVLREESRPILLYGTGNGADKIIDVMERRGMRPSGVFASDGFVRSREFRGMRVMSYAQALSAFGEDAVILVAFGSPRDSVLNAIRSLAQRHTLYIPDVPLFADDPGAELFTPEYVISHSEEISRADGLFGDDSRELFREILAYRITADPKYLRRTEKFDVSVRTCLPQDTVCVIDGGAFNGDTARTFLANLPRLQRVICVEPDSRTFRRLSEAALTDGRITAINASLGESVGTDMFSMSASRASAVEKQNMRSRTSAVQRLTVDYLAGYGDSGTQPGASVGQPGTTEGDSSGSDIAGYAGAAAGDGRLLIKLDVEGAECECLRGARRTITGRRPALAISLYHRTADIFRIPLFLHEICPDYGFTLRRARCVPGWEITLFAR